jgi:ribosomal protein S18 acetylase RimI-like enzyme
MIYLIKDTELYKQFKLKTDIHKFYDYYDNGVHVGRFLIESITDDYYTLWKVKIFEEFRGKGYGKKMLDEILSTFKKDFYLYVRKDNIIAINLYLKFGFDENNDKIKKSVKVNRYLNLIKFKRSYK